MPDPLTDPPAGPPRRRLPGPLAGQLAFPLPGGARALFTDRSLANLSTLRGPASEPTLTRRQGLAARERLRESLSLRRLLAGPQVHGREVQRITTAPEQLAPEQLAPEQLAPEQLAADGRATHLSGVGVMVLTADCLPVIVASENAVAALHAGWRGLAAGVLEEGVLAVRELSKRGARARARVHARAPAAEELVAILGPCAGACCYEVGPEVREIFGGPPVKAALDLQAIARRRLLRAGVTDVASVSMCTICDPRFFSHRREGHRAGRQAGVAWLP